MKRFVQAGCAVAVAFLLNSCVSGPTADVHVKAGADLGWYDMVFVMAESDWIANHTITGLLIQELQRRRYSVKIGQVPEEAYARALMLKIDSAGAKNESGEGPTNRLKQLRFRLRQFHDGDLATVVYSGATLDPIGQKELVRQIADEIFGAR
ncbi:MAG: hypothetical protein ACI8UO_000031 [Verrucomicrobiales bacterium]|jgi:hypothetical protein